MANIKSVGGNPIVLGLDGLTDDAKAALGNSKLSAAAESLLGTPDTAQWAQRVTTGSGAATVRSVQGAAVVWNQYVDYEGVQSSTVSDLTITNNSDGSFTVNGTATAQVVFNVGLRKAFPPSHIELIKGCPAGGSTATYRLRDGYGAGSDVGSGLIETRGATTEYAVAQIVVASGYTCDNLVFRPQLFDLTAMFGAGNEPSTVAEFEALYPEPYYPYSAPTLKPVRIEGIQSVGFNQWDEQWELGRFDTTTGSNIPSDTQIRSKNLIPVLPSTEYYVQTPNGIWLMFLDADKHVITSGLPVSQTSYNSRCIGGETVVHSFTMPANCHYVKWYGQNAYGATYKHDICINISNPALNGQYKPYTTDSVEWTAQTLRAAGSVRDELTSGELVTRVGVVDLGTLTWYTATASDVQYFYADFPSGTAQPALPPSVSDNPNISCVPYVATKSGLVVSTDKSIGLASNSQRVFVHDSSYSDAATFKTAMSGIMLYYELATPTTQPMSPALPMTYRVEQGGTESTIVPTGEISAAPVLTVAEGESAADVVMDALACIAMPDGPVATANHALGTYLTYNGKLYKVTSAIAVGETITAGTNVTATTVMDEILALN